MKNERYLKRVAATHVYSKKIICLNIKSIEITYNFS